VTRPEAADGGPNDPDFDSAVLYARLRDTDDLTHWALSRYKTFVGKLWERFGGEAWMGPWEEVDARGTRRKPIIAAHLHGIADRDARLAVPMIRDNIDRGSPEGPRRLVRGLRPPGCHRAASLSFR